MTKSKTAFDYFSPRHYNLSAQHMILTANEDQREVRCRQFKYKKQNEKRREKNLKKLIEVFSDAFDVEFPEISAQVKDDLFMQWEKINYNKELVQADIQIKNLLEKIGNTGALSRWNEIYKDFRMDFRAEI